MIVFERVRENLTMLGVDIHQSGGHFLVNFARIKVLSLLLLNFISFTIYAFHGADDFLKLINTVFLSSISLCAFVTVCYCTWKTKNIYKLLDNTEEMINARIVNAISKTIYVGTDKKFQYWSKIMDFCIAKGTPICVTLPIFVVSMFKYFGTDLGNEAFDLPFHQWYPFSWKNPIGYGCAFAFEYKCSTAIFFMASTSLKFLIGIYLFLFSMIEDTKCDLESINRKAKIKKAQMEATKQLFDVIQFHAKLIQLSNNLSEFGKFLYTLLFTWSLTAICSSMMLLQNEIEQNENNAALIILLLFELFWSFALIFTTCELGERASLTFGEIDCTVDQFNLYYFPSDMKKLLPILMAMTQKPFRIAVFGSITCGRESFKKVINTGFSYFMVLQNFQN